VAAACVVLVVAISVATSPGINLSAMPDEEHGTVSVAAGMPPDEVVRILNVRCSMCHAPEPLWPGIPVAPKGVMLDTPEHIARFAPAIREQAVLSWAMPPNNITAIEPDERAEVGRWLATLR
jgi:uncharacterized membrane protein